MCQVLPDSESLGVVDVLASWDIDHAMPLSSTLGGIPDLQVLSCRGIACHCKVQQLMESRGPLSDTYV